MVAATLSSSASRAMREKGSLVGGAEEETGAGVGDGGGGGGAGLLRSIVIFAFVSRIQSLAMVDDLQGELVGSCM